MLNLPLLLWAYQETKEEKYKQQITELRRQLHEAELDRDILKTLATITKKQPR